MPRTSVNPHCIVVTHLPHTASLRTHSQPTSASSSTPATSRPLSQKLPMPLVDCSTKIPHHPAKLSQAGPAPKSVWPSLSPFSHLSTKHPSGRIIQSAQLESHLAFSLGVSDTPPATPGRILSAASSRELDVAAPDVLDLVTSQSPRPAGPAHKDWHSTECLAPCHFRP